MDTVNKVRNLLSTTLHEHLSYGCPGVILEINIPQWGFSFSEAQGLFAFNNSRPLKSSDLFRAASITKSITAALAVSLASNQRWKLDDPVVQYLPENVHEMLLKLNNISICNGNELTIRRLLNHSSGLPDYFFDPQFQEQTRKYPNRIWKPEELIEMITKVGKLHFPPGTDFSYGDTAYVLVGIAIQNLLGCRLADAYRSYIFHPLKMDSTFLEWHENFNDNDLSHHYSGNKDLRFINFSYDWAGGGLATSVSDLTKFLHGLFGGSLFNNNWLDELTQWQEQTNWKPHSSARYIQYGLGIGKNIFHGEEIIGATGVWGGFAYYWPAADCTVTGTLNFVQSDRAALMESVIKIIKNHIL